MDQEEVIEVYSTTNPGEAEVVKTVLEGEGIKCQLDTDNEASLPGIVGVRVLVRAWDEDRARKVLAANRHHQEGHSTSVDPSRRDAVEPGVLRVFNSREETKKYYAALPAFTTCAALTAARRRDVVDCPRKIRSGGILRGLRRNESPCQHAGYLETVSR